MGNIPVKPVIILCTATLLLGLAIGYGAGSKFDERPSSDEFQSELISEWRGSAQGRVVALEHGFITISNDFGVSIHAVIDESTVVRRTRITGAQHQEIQSSISDLSVGQDAVILVLNKDGMVRVLEVNIVDVVQGQSQS